MNRMFLKFGKEIQQVRKRKGLTQEQLADILGWDQPKLSRIERGTQEPTLSESFEIMEALGAEMVATFVIPDGLSRVHA